MSQTSALKEIDDFRQHFDAMYVGGIPNLLNDNGFFLAFVAVLTGTEALAGLFAPTSLTGDRFRSFIATYYPEEYWPFSDRLWEFRNVMIHSFNPGPFALTHHNSRHHLKAPLGITMLNAEDFYAALLAAARAYFEAGWWTLNCRQIF
ncbi:MAG: hypothetical protein H0V16_03720 [Burkholderiaceae bacterium]|nr:hypothetical protein [Burkholderiaceae bacterium]